MVALLLDDGLADAAFVASSRRHTIFDCDWSSDVCSSDLPLTRLLSAGFDLALTVLSSLLRVVSGSLKNFPKLVTEHFGDARKTDLTVPPAVFGMWTNEIGRASCRERV